MHDGSKEQETTLGPTERSPFASSNDKQRKNDPLKHAKPQITCTSYNHK